MATGPEMLDAVLAAIRARRLPPPSEFVINKLDVSDLTKLNTADFVARGFGDAEALHDAVSAQNLVPLGQALGVFWKFDENAPSLLDN